MVPGSDKRVFPSPGTPTLALEPIQSLLLLMTFQLSLQMHMNAKMQIYWSIVNDT